MLRGRVPQLILAVAAGYEGRGLVTSLVHAIGLLSGPQSAFVLWLLAALALPTGLTLFHVGRGLDRVARPPKWALALLGLWLMLGSVLVVLSSLAGHGLGIHGLAPDGPWPDAPGALGVALVLAVVVQGGRWLGRHPPSVRLSLGFAAVTDRFAVRALASERPPLARGLLAGWSDRGPPVRLSPQPN